MATRIYPYIPTSIQHAFRDMPDSKAISSNNDCSLIKCRRITTKESFWPLNEHSLCKWDIHCHNEVCIIFMNYATTHWSKTSHIWFSLSSVFPVIGVNYEKGAWGGSSHTNILVSLKNDFQAELIKIPVLKIRNCLSSQVFSKWWTTRPLRNQLQKHSTSAYAVVF